MERDGDNKRPRAPKPAAGKPAGKRYERARGGPARAISELMPDIGRTAFRRFGFVQSSVVTRWPEIVGRRHAEVCAPESIRFPPGEKSDGILQLVVRPAHAPLIQHVIPEIIERVNRFFGYKAVSRVKLRQGEVKGSGHSERAAAAPSLKPIPMELGESLRDIGDPELRTVLESLARSLGAKEEGELMNFVFRAALLIGAALLSTAAAPNWITHATLTNGGHLLGNPDAKIKLIAFESYTCPHCADFEEEAGATIKLAYVRPGNVSYEVHHFIRDNVDLTAAMLSECVPPAKFFDVHRTLFLNFDKWAPLMGTASKAQRDRWFATDRAAGRRAIASDFGFYDLLASQGLSRVQADKCLGDAALAKRLADQTKADDEKYNIEGTPSFALNGMLLLATHQWSLLRPQIDARL